MREDTEIDDTAEIEDALDTAPEDALDFPYEPDEAPEPTPHLEPAGRAAGTIWSAAFWKGAGERALKTFIQSFVAALLATIGAAVTAWEVPWDTALFGAAGVALLAAVLSLATSLGNADFTAGPPDGTVE